ncbi:MAG: OmpA family protein [Methylococcales bacterium]|nr:OmpA family protein [Methylococcales bacterium]
MVITLSDVLFNTNKAQLKSGGTRNVQKLADFLTQYPQYKVLVEGHTDSVGSDDLNQELSDRRAYAVRTALMGMAISNDRVTTRGYGEAFPVSSNDNAASRQLNRRVEIILSDNNGNIAPR